MATERQMAELLGRRLGIDFGTTTRHLDGWGRADRCVEVREDLWLLLEIEGKQHHPSTNVLKLWPFLERRRKLSVVLIHAFEKTGKELRKYARPVCRVACARDEAPSAPAVHLLSRHSGRDVGRG